ncbi:MAG: hypothetical protein AAF467_14085 [Actinomycetota bacterium]
MPVFESQQFAVPWGTTNVDPTGLRINAPPSGIHADEAATPAQTASDDEPDLSIPIRFPGSAESLILLIVIAAVLINGVGASLQSMATRWQTFWRGILTFSVILAVALVWARIRG